MNDERIRESLRACLSDSRFPAQCQREVLERIHGEQPLMKRKIPYAVVLAAVLVLAMSALAVAAGLGVFGSLKDNLNGEINSARLERLDQAADSVGAGASISVYAADPAPNATYYDRILAAQGKVRLHTTKYPLDRFQQAIDDLDAGHVRGRAILVPGS